MYVFTHTHAHGRIHERIVRVDRMGSVCNGLLLHLQITVYLFEFLQVYILILCLKIGDRLVRFIRIVYMM